MPQYKVEDGKVKFQCGCQFSVIGPPPLPKGNFPAIKFNPDLFYPDHDIKFDCKPTWKMLGEGKVKTVFQLEQGAGKRWTKELKPTCVEDISALASIIRPGCSQGFDEHGVSLTQHYCKRKNGEEAVEVIHPAIGPALEKTQGIMIYQENIIRLSKDLAGFNEQEADLLRKAIGKKLPEEMAKAKTMFLEGCEKQNIVDEKIAAQLFDWIEKSQRYLFCKAHAVGYGLLGYITAFSKYHFPLQTYRSCLRAAQGDADTYEEILELVNDAKLMDIEVKPPDITHLRGKFHTDGKAVYFGLSDIKDVGPTFTSKLKKTLEEQSVDINAVGWLDFLFNVLDKFSITVGNRLIETGALSRFAMQRQQMLKEFEIWHDKLGEATEKKWILEHRGEFDSLVDALKAVAKPRKDGGGCANCNRVEIVKSLAKSLENPPTPLIDTPDWIAWCEKEHLGVPLTYTELDKYDLTFATHKCKDIVKGHKGYAVLGVQVNRVGITKIKRGADKDKEMAFITASDGSCSLEGIIAFSEPWAKYGHLLTQDAAVFISGKLNKKGSFQIERVYPMASGRGDINDGN